MHRILPPRHTLTFQAKTRLICFAMCGVGWGVFLQADRGLAQESSVPWECTGYADEARLRCMNTLLELQQKKITELEQQLHAQEETVKVLEEKMERRKALARREAQAKRQDHRYPPPPYRPAYSYLHYDAYGYAPFAPSFGLYVQPPWRVPRYYGYGPGYWRQPGLSFHFRFGKGYKYRRR